MENSTSLFKHILEIHSSNEMILSQPINPSQTEKKFLEIEQVLNATTTFSSDFKGILEHATNYDLHDMIQFIRLVLECSTSTTSSGLLRRVQMYELIGDFLNQYEQLPTSLTNGIVHLVSREIDCLEVHCIPYLLEKLILGLIQRFSKEVEDWKAFELIPVYLLSLIQKSPVQLPVLQQFKPSEDIRHMSTEDYVDFMLRKLAVMKVPPGATMAFIAMLKEIPMNDSQLDTFSKKILDQFMEIELEGLPALVYQSLLFTGRQSMLKKTKQTLLQGIVAHLESLEQKGEDEDQVWSQLSQSQPTIDSIRTAKYDTKEMKLVFATILNHLNFVAKQDHEVGALFIEEMKQIAKDETGEGFATMSCLKLAMCFSLGTIPQYEPIVIDILKKCLHQVFPKNRKNPLMLENKVENKFMELIRSIKFGWDGILPSIVKLCFSLLECGGKSSPMLIEFCTTTLYQLFNFHKSVQSHIINETMSIILSKSSVVLDAIALLHRITSKCALQVAEQLPLIQSNLECLGLLTPLISLRLLQALEPVRRLKASLNDHMVLVIRKSMFRREEPIRCIAIYGLFHLLNANLRDNTFWQYSGFFKRVLQHQPFVRMIFYSNIYNLPENYPDALRHHFDDLLLQHFLRFYESNEGFGFPLKLDKCLLPKASDWVEPIGYLLQTMFHSVRRGSQRVADTLNVFLNRMKSTEFIEELEMTFATKMLVLGVYESIMNHIALCNTMDGDTAGLILEYFGVYEQIFRQEVEEPKKSVEATEESDLYAICAMKEFYPLLNFDAIILLLQYCYGSSNENPMTTNTAFQNFLAQHALQYLKLFRESSTNLIHVLEYKPKQQILQLAPLVYQAITQLKAESVVAESKKARKSKKSSVVKSSLYKMLTLFFDMLQFWFTKSLDPQQLFMALDQVDTIDYYVAYLQNKCNDWVEREYYSETEMGLQTIMLLLHQMPATTYSNYTNWIYTFLCKHHAISSKECHEILLKLFIHIHRSPTELNGLVQLANGIRLHFDPSYSTETELQLVERNKGHENAIVMFAKEIMETHGNEVASLWKSLKQPNMDPATSKQLYERLHQLAQAMTPIFGATYPSKLNLLIFRMAIHYYKFMANMSKHTKDVQVIHFPEFNTLFQYLFRELTPAVLTFISATMECNKHEAQLQRSRKKKAKSNKRVSTNLLRQTSVIPTLIYQVEQVDVNMMKFAQLAKYDRLHSWIHRRQARDFRLNTEQLKQALANQGSSSDESDEESSQKKSRI